MTWRPEDHPRQGKGKFSDAPHSQPEGDLPVTRLYPETQRKLRGHKFFLSATRNWPALGETDGNELAETPFVARYMIGSAQWLVSEFDPETGDAFGYADIGHGEFGSFNLYEMERERFNPSGFPQVVERDLDFKPGTLARDCIDKYRNQ